MLKTSKDLMEWLGLQIGDKVKFTINDITYVGVVGFYDNILSLIVENKNNFENEVNAVFNLYFIIHKEVEYEILPRPKRVGDLKCEDFEGCINCPLRAISGCEYQEGISLYDILQAIKESEIRGNRFDQEIYDLLMARLDKEVKSDETD